MDRRLFLKAAAAASAALGGAAPALAGPTRQAATNAVPRQPLVNREQAERVMGEHGLDGLIALNPVNVYYLTNTIPIGTKMRWEYPAFATFARRPGEPTFLVTTTAQLMDVVTADRWVPEFVPYSAPANWHDYTGDDALPPDVEPEAAPSGFPVRRDSPLGWRERAWDEAYRNYQPSPTPEWALARALEQSGLTRGRIAVDDMRIATLLEKIGAAKDVEFVDGDNIFRRIRYVKSPVEIELMRVAARKNHAAAVATIRSLAAGMTFGDIERLFAIEAAKRGNDVTFLIAGMSLGRLPEGIVESGEPFLVDAVSHHAQYHGDFARTVVIGEAGPEVKRRARAQQAAREATLELARPGTRYSQIRAAGVDAYRKAGGDPATFIVNPHSVGLQHTDQPYREDVPFRVGDDLELVPGMTITIDLPYIEIGFGAGHNEDLLLITETGYELLHAVEDPTIEV